MRTLRIEMHRGNGAGSCAAKGKIPAEVTVEQIAHDLQEYAIQFPHRALVDGVEVARAGREVKPSRDALDALLAS
jgi:hypothetical protein